MQSYTSNLKNCLVKCINTSNSYNSIQLNKLENIFFNILNELSHSTKNIEIGQMVYRETNGEEKHVIYMRFLININFNGKSFPILTKINFPPNFPFVPPIVSIVNSDENRLQVNAKYINFMLPDKTFEVKLMNSRTWFEKKDFNVLLVEFIGGLSANFPFFQTANPITNKNYTVYFDPRYNDPNVTFPFDYSSNININPFPQNNFQAATLPPRPPPVTFGNNIPLNNIYPPPVPPPYFIPNCQPGYIPIQTAQPFIPNNYQGAQDQTAVFQKFKSKVEMEMNQITEAIEELSKVNRGVQKMTNDVKSKSKQFQEFKQETTQKQNNGKDADDLPNPLNMDKYVDFGNSSNKEILETHGRLKGIQETIFLLEDSFFDNPNVVNTETILQQLHILYMKEFDQKLILTKFA